MSNRQLRVFRASENDLDWSEAVVTATGEDKITGENMWNEKKA